MQIKIHLSVKFGFISGLLVLLPVAVAISSYVTNFECTVPPPNQCHRASLPTSYFSQGILNPLFFDAAVLLAGTFLPPPPPLFIDFPANADDTGTFDGSLYFDLSTFFVVTP